MWNSEKSIALSHFLVRLFYVILAFVCVGAPFLSKYTIASAFVPYIYIPLYLAAPAGLIALICLDKLLLNIKKDIAFEPKNVKLLRILSWCCFYAAAVSIAFFVGMYVSHNKTMLSFIVLFVAEIFVGLVVRVVKNIIAKAIEIKEENDYTV